MFCESNRSCTIYDIKRAVKKIPGRFETVTERVLVQEESYELVTVGAGGGGGIVPGRGTIQVTVGSTTYSIDSSGNVSDASGRRVGAVDASGNIVGNNGSVIAASQQLTVSRQTAAFVTHLDHASVQSTVLATSSHQAATSSRALRSTHIAAAVVHHLVPLHSVQ